MQQSAQGQSLSLARVRSVFCAVLCLWLLAPGLSASAQQSGGLSAANQEQSLFKLNASKLDGGNFSDFSDLGVKAYKDKNYAQAEQMFSTALNQAVKQKVGGGRLAIMLTNLASAYREQHRYKESEQTFKQALDVALGTTGEDRQSLPYVVNQYKALLTRTDRSTEAQFLEAAAKDDFRLVKEPPRMDSLAEDPYFRQARAEQRAFVSQRVEWLGDRPRMDWRPPQNQQEYPVVPVNQPQWPAVDETQGMPPPMGVVPCPCHAFNGMPPPPAMPFNPYMQFNPWFGMRPQMMVMGGMRMHGHHHHRHCR